MFHITIYRRESKQAIKISFTKQFTHNSLRSMESHLGHLNILFIPIEWLYQVSWLNIPSECFSSQSVYTCPVSIDFHRLYSASCVFIIYDLRYYTPS